MKDMTVGEKFELIRYHGAIVAHVGHIGAIPPRRSQILESAQCIIEIAKTIPKSEYGIE